MTPELKDWDFIHSIHIDDNNKFLVGLGEQKLIIFDI